MGLLKIHFWIIHILFVLGFLGGIFYKTTTILHGNIEPYSEYKISRWSKFWYFFAGFFKTFFSRKLGKIIMILITDVFLHFKLLKENKLKWIAHTCIFWGLTALFILSVLSGIAVEIAPALGYGGGNDFLDILADMDFWGTAVLNEWLNILVMAGIIIALIRGFISKKSKGMFMFQDVFLIIFIVLILISGWLTEGLRYIVEHTPGYIARLGILGYYSSRALLFVFPNTSESAWEVTHTTAWHVHVSIVWLSFVYIPLSKFSHALFSPVASVLNVLEKNHNQELAR